jgi:predicted SAM-dependent methyltransferase/GT2 family glycosyltransferase
MQKVYILLPVHNRNAVTEQFIDCLAAQTYANYHLVLIDDGSTDGTAEMVQARIKELTVLKGRGDWWWAGSLQQGIRWLRGRSLSRQDVILIVNDDVAFPPDFLERAVAILRQQPDTLVLSQLQNETTGEPMESGISVDWKSFTFDVAESPEKINCLSTRGLFLRWGDMEKIGGFYPNLLPHYWSDYEFTLRAAKRGFRLVTSPQLLVRSIVHGASQASLDNLNLSGFIKTLFSMKTSYHPLHRYAFVLLACPVKWIPMNLARLTRSYLVMFLRQLRASWRIFLEHQKISRLVRQQRIDMKVILGASHTHFPGWISTNYPTVDITSRDSMSRHFKAGAVSAFLAEHVWEHLTPAQAVEACRNCFDALAPGGYLRMAVPDGLHSDPAYIEQVKPGGSGSGSDEHKVLYTHKTLSNLLESVGFEILLLEYFDEDGRFHYSEWSPDDGMIRRSRRFDKRNAVKPTAYTSLILDALKPS